MKSSLFIKYSRLILFLLLLSGSLIGQNYQRFIVATLSSPSMEGRGYVNNGADKAAQFIATQFDSLDLIPLNESYYHSFEMYVNRFPGELYLKIDDELLIPGIDYLVSPQSGNGLANNYQLKPINLFKRKQLENLNKNIQGYAETALLITMPDTLSSNGKFLFMQTVYLLCEQWPVLLITSEKLTWGVSNNQLTKPLFIINSKAISKRSKVSFHVKAEKLKMKQENVMAFKKGKQSDSKYIIISAHYDHLGRMGQDTYFPGANDNASGVAAMLALASSIKGLELNHHILFIAFSGEEAGLLGSTHFVNNPPIPLKSIDFVLNLDLNGTGEEGIAVINATEFKEEFELLDQVNTSQKAFTHIQKRGPASNSDHYPFYKKNIPSFFIYTKGGIKAYHDIYDKPETLPLTKAAELVELYKEFVVELDTFY